MKKTDFIYRSVRASLLSFTVLLLAGPYVGVPGLNVMLVLLSLLLPFAFFFFVETGLRGRLITAAWIVLVIVFIAAFFGFQRSFEFVSGFPAWERGSGYPKEFAKGYTVLQGILLILGSCMLDLLFSLSSYTAGVPALLVLAALVYFYITKKELNRAAVVFSFSLIFVTAAEVIERFWKKRKSGLTYRCMLFLLPFMLIFLLLLIPAARNKKDPYDWKFVVEAYERISKGFEALSERLNFGGRGTYSFSYTGFSEDGSVGGNLKQEEREIFVLTPGSAMKTGLYLSGQAYTDFDGKDWKSANLDTENASVYDTISMLYGLRRFDPEHLQDYYYAESIDLEYRFFRSDHLFFPLKTRKLKLTNAGKRVELREKDDAVLLSKVQGYGTSYHFEYYEMNSRTKLFRELLLAEQEENPQLLKRMLADEKTLHGDALTESGYQARKEEIKKVYSTAPVLTERTKALIERITKDAETPVDRLYAIEQYLAGMHYTSSPGSLPEEIADPGAFLDYFLFERPEGYCTYFATAFALLARTEGFPSRYVQGFVADHRTVAPFPVYSSMSHAWPEVYFENAGWVAFEPTPGYASYRYRGWAVSNRSEGSGSGEGTLPIPTGPTGPPEEEREEWVDPETLNPPAETVDYGRLIRYFLYFLAAVVLLAIILFVIERTIRIMRYRRAKTPERYRLLVKENLRLLSLLKLERKDDTTLEELSERASEALELERPLRFIRDYESVIYGKKEVAPAMPRTAEKEQSLLLRILKRRDRLRALYFRLFVRAG